MNTQDLIEAKVHEIVGELQNFDLGSDEHRRALGDVMQLTDRLIKMKEDELERKRFRLEKQKAETDAQKVEIEQSKLDIENEKLKIEQLKMGITEAQAKLEEKRVELEREKATDERKGRWMQNCLTAIGILLPTAVTIIGMVLMFLFEEKGTIAGGASRKIVDRIFRMK